MTSLAVRIREEHRVDGKRRREREPKGSVAEVTVPTASSRKANCGEPTSALRRVRVYNVPQKSGTFSQIKVEEFGFFLNNYLIRSRVSSRPRDFEYEIIGWLNLEFESVEKKMN